MAELTVKLLRIGLLIGTIGAIAQLIWMIGGLILPIRWYWGGAIAFLLSPVAFALTLRLLEPVVTRRHVQAEAVE